MANPRLASGSCLGHYKRALGLELELFMVGMGVVDEVDCIIVMKIMGMRKLRSRLAGIRRDSGGAALRCSRLGGFRRLRRQAGCWLAAVCWTGLAAAGPARYLDRPETWFAGDEAKAVATNLLSYQSPLGGWPKNLDTTRPRSRPLATTELQPTFDNGATTDELRFLARVYRATQEAGYRSAFVQGLDYILKAQYPTGGWPQSYPPDGMYHRHITFNDGAMVRLMEFLRETYSRSAYEFVDPERRQAARSAFDRGIRCILKCQIKVDGRLTAWCAQHDEKDYQPRGGRTYELPSLSGSESVGIVRLLMSLSDPSPEVSAAIEGAVAWFKSAQLPGIKVVRVSDPQAPRGWDRRVITDPAAPPMWARFYEIGSNQPIFSDRDGVRKRQLAELGYERRNGYGWLGYWPQSLLAKEYPAWTQKRLK